MSYVVARRTRELGIRMALGATSRKVVTMVLRDSAAMVLPGLAIGVPLGMAASRPLSSQLYGVQINDPWTLAAVALVLAVVALLATLEPLERRRASIRSRCCATNEVLLTPAAGRSPDRRAWRGRWELRTPPS